MPALQYIVPQKMVLSCICLYEDARENDFIFFSSVNCTFLNKCLVHIFVLYIATGSEQPDAANIFQALSNLERNVFEEAITRLHNTIRAIHHTAKI